MNARVEPPPKRGMGCFTKGCLILVALWTLLVVVGISGSFWILRHTYLSDKPMPMPEASMPSETSAATPGETSVAPPSETTATARERLDTIKSAARAHERTGVEFTAGEINALIAANRKSRGAALVRIDGNVAQVQLSIPLERRSISKCIWSGRSVFERHCHDGSAAGNQREQRAAERGDTQWPQLSHRSAGPAITRSRTIAAKLRDQICQPVWRNGWRNQRWQSNLAHQ